MKTLSAYMKKIPPDQSRVAQAAQLQRGDLQEEEGWVFTFVIGCSSHTNPNTKGIPINTFLSIESITITHVSNGLQRVELTVRHTREGLQESVALSVIIPSGDHTQSQTCTEAIASAERLLKYALQPV